MRIQFKNIIRIFHLWAGLISGVIIFIVCITGCIYTFRTQIENGLNYKNLYVDTENVSPVSLDTLYNKLKNEGYKINTISIFDKPNRSIEIAYTLENGNGGGTCYVNPYTSEILGFRTTRLSPFFEFILSLHKTLLLSDVGKQIVGIAVIIFVLMLFSGFILWLPRKLKELFSSLVLHWKKNSPLKTIELHKIPGLYSLLLLCLIAIMGLYITYPWVKSTLIVSFGGNPILSKASDKQKEKIKKELAGSFSQLLNKQLAENNVAQDSVPTFSIDSVLATCNKELCYGGITQITLPTTENSWVKIKKVNRENIVRAIVYDELEFNKNGVLTGKFLFKDKRPDQKLIALSLPLHTGEILGWPSLIVYFIVSLVGASLPITGSVVWFRRKKEQLLFQKTKRIKKSTNKKLNTENKDDWLIAYATKSGNSKLIALELQKQFYNCGYRVKCKSTARISTKNIKTIKNLFIIISTDGEGVPPPSAIHFFNDLRTSNNGDLENLNFAICALGDSSYEHYCKAGIDLDILLQSKKAQSIIPRTDCDVDFSTPAVKWVKSILKMTTQPSTDNKEHSNVLIQNRELEQGCISKIAKITKGNSTKPCFHIELDVPKDISHIQPGDSIEIIPQNPQWLVEKIIETLKLPDNIETAQFLKNDVELTTLSHLTIERYNKVTGNNNLAEKQGIKKYASKANFLDLISDFPSEVNFSELKAILPKIKGRLYSIASSTKQHPHKIHLTIKSIKYSYHNRHHEGAGSVYISEQLKPGSKLNFKHYPNLEFRLPQQKQTPLIMIGTGTGLAPFRAFMQDYAEHKITDKMWLIWGDKKQNNDFIYEDEIKQYCSYNLLSKVSLAFSRDSEEKVYVQDLVMQEKELFLTWLADGAHIYVCGSIDMGNAIKSSITEILKNTPRNSNKITIETLFKENRYHEDTY